MKVCWTWLFYFTLFWVFDMTWAKEIHVQWNHPMAVDSGGAGSAAKPFRTISYAVGRLRAGDTCWIHGGTYRENVVVTARGEPGAPVSILAVPGEKVVLTGLDTVSLHKNPGDSLWRWKGRQSDTVTQVFMGGRLFSESRWPTCAGDPLRDSCYARIATIRHEFQDGILVRALVGDSTMPPLSVRSTHFVSLGNSLENPHQKWFWVAHAIEGDAGGRLRIHSSYMGYNSHTPLVGDLYYIDGRFNEPFANRQWAWSQGELKVRIDSLDFKGTIEVRRKSRRLVLDIQSPGHVHVEGLELRAGTARVQGSHHVLKKMRIVYPVPYFAPMGQEHTPEGKGVELYGSFNVLEQSEVAYSWGDLVTVEGESNEIRDSYLHDGVWSGTDHALVDIRGNGHRVLGSTLAGAGRSALLFRNAKGVKILDNRISGCGMLTYDFGCIYTFHTDAQGKDGMPTEIVNNRISNVERPSASAVHYYDTQAASGTLVYLDNGTSHVTVSHNSLWGTTAGVQVNLPGTNTGFSSHGIEVSRNTIWSSYLSIALGFVGGDYADIRILDNVTQAGMQVVDDKEIEVRGNLMLPNDGRFPAFFRDARSGDFRPLVGKFADDIGEKGCCGSDDPAQRGWNP